MLPIPSATAMYCFLGVLVCTLVGAFTGSLPATVIGISGAIGLATALAATMPLGRRARKQRLEFAWWLGHGDPGSGGGAAVPGAPFEVRCFLRHRGNEALTLSELVPVVPGGARVMGEGRAALSLAPAARTEFTFKLIAPAVGRVVLHGLAVMLEGPLGLFSVPLYFPNPLVVKVLPQAAARRPSGTRTSTGLPVERAGASIMAPHGGGTELREIREMRPGDPFKSIAWKATARRGKLLVREVDQEVQETRYVVLDVSGTMRGGELGRRKLDLAIEATAADARRALANGDRFGLVTVDGRVLSHVAPKDGSAQILRVFDALLAATEIVDGDLTDVDDDDVVQIVGRYVRQQDGIDFVGKDGGWNVSLLVRHVHRALAADNSRTDAVSASNPAMATMRRFCRVRGIPLPHRPDPRDGAKGPGMAAVLRELASRGLGPTTIVVVTDLDGVGDVAPVVAGVKLLRLHGHDVVFVVPDATTFAERPSGGTLEADLWDIYARGEKRRSDQLAAQIRPLGARVVRASSADSAAFLLLRAGKRTRRGRAA